MKNIFFYFTLMFFVALGASPLHAVSYDDDVLEIFSKIVPRLVLMSSAKNTLKDKIELCVVYEPVDERKAAFLGEKISASYPAGIKDYKIRLVPTAYGSFDACRNSQLMFLFNTNESHLQKALSFAENNAIMTISYDPKYLEKGVGLSLFLGRKVTPYINVMAFKKSGIALENTLLHISKIYSGEDDR